MAEFRYAVHVSPFLDYFDFVWSPDAFEKKNDVIYSDSIGFQCRGYMQITVAKSYQNK